MSENTMMIVAILISIIQIILILSVVHISAKSDEMTDELKEMNEKLSKIAKSAEPSSFNNSAKTAPIIKNNGNTWTCPKCSTVNPTSSRICKGCGRDK